MVSVSRVFLGGTESGFGLRFRFLNRLWFLSLSPSDFFCSLVDKSGWDLVSSIL